MTPEPLQSTFQPSGRPQLLPGPGTGGVRAPEHRWPSSPPSWAEMGTEGGLAVHYTPSLRCRPKAWRLVQGCRDFPFCPPPGSPVRRADERDPRVTAPLLSSVRAVGGAAGTHWESALGLGARPLPLRLATGCTGHSCLLMGPGCPWVSLLFQMAIGSFRSRVWELWYLPQARGRGGEAASR